MSLFLILSLKANMNRFKKKCVMAVKVLFLFMFSFNFILGEVKPMQMKIKKIKFIEKNVPKSSLTLAKEFQSTSFSSLTCAASTEIMGKHAFHFDDEKQSCKIFEVRAELNLKDDAIGNEKNLVVKIDGQ